MKEHPFGGALFFSTALSLKHGSIGAMYLYLGRYRKEGRRQVDRTRVTFEQAEGAEPLPSQLKLGEVSKELRAVLWAVVHDSLEEDLHRSSNKIVRSWRSVLYGMHIFKDHKMADDFSENWYVQCDNLKSIFQNGDYIKVFGTLQWIFRHKDCPERFPREIDQALEHCRSAYRVIDKDTIAPIASMAEGEAIETAIEKVTTANFLGARSHLLFASTAATEGRWSDSVRESIQAVESVARSLSPGTKELGPALAKLEEHGSIHGALKKGFSAIYGFTSDERGIRHSLLEADKANVDEADALFMLGACASFVTYLISRGREAGIIEEDAA